MGNLRKMVTVTAGTRLQTDHPEEEEEEEEEESENAWVTAWDDVSGHSLDANEVKKARAKEMGYIADKAVWRRIPRSVALRNNWKVISTRWIDINKGDAQEPNYRSRL